MEKRIIFDLPEGASGATIFLDLFKRFGIKNDSSAEKSKLTTVVNACKDLYAKKIAEDSFVALLEKYLETNEENAKIILSELKEKFLPFAKEINFKENNAVKIESPGVHKLPDIINEDQIKKIETPKPKRKLPEKDFSLSPASKSDRYREPIG